MGYRLFFVLSLWFALQSDIGNNGVVVNGFAPSIVTSATKKTTAVLSPSSSSATRIRKIPQQLLVQSIQSSQSNEEGGRKEKLQQKREKNSLKNVMASTLLVTSLMMNTLSFSGNAANAAVIIDSDVDAVEKVMQDLKSAGNNPEKIFSVYENIAEIISEGKGIGGIVNYKGVQLDRGYVADEDTSIYNPGLTLLTESEKNTIVDSIIQSRKSVTSRDWPENNEAAFKEIKQKLDPYSMTELRGYLSIVPYYSAFLYIGVLGVQQFIARPTKNQEIFNVAYGVAALALFLPAIGLIIAGV